MSPRIADISLVCVDGSSTGGATISFILLGRGFPSGTMVSVTVAVVQIDEDTGQQGTRTEPSNVDVSRLGKLHLMHDAAYVTATFSSSSKGSEELEVTVTVEGESDTHCVPLP